MKKSSWKLDLAEEIYANTNGGTEPCWTGNTVRVYAFVADTLSRDGQLKAAADILRWARDRSDNSDEEEKTALKAIIKLTKKLTDKSKVRQIDEATVLKIMGNVPFALLDHTEKSDPLGNSLLRVWKKAIKTIAARDATLARETASIIINSCHDPQYNTVRPLLRQATPKGFRPADYG